MTLIAHTCYTIECDGCGAELETPEQGELHFCGEADRPPSLPDINGWFDWLELGPTCHMCPDCAGDCRKTGRHEFDVESGQCEICEAAGGERTGERAALLRG